MSAGERRHRGWAALAWFGCLLGLALVFESIVLAAEIGPFNVLVVIVIAGALVAAAACARWFWRLSGAMGGHPRAAVVVLLVALAWAAAGAWVLELLIVAFRGT